MDLPADRGADVRGVVDLSRELEACARFVPRDYSTCYFDRVRCDVVVAKLAAKGGAGRRRGGKRERHVDRPLLRLQIFKRDDPLALVERDLPPDARPSQLLGKVSCVVEVGSTLAELAAHAAGFHDLANRLWGPQAGELGAAGADPRSFRLATRAARRAALDLVDRVDSMKPEELRDLLENEGYTSTGAFARSPDGRGLGGTAARARLKAVLLRKAARIGFGELSAFGEAIATRMFRRFDAAENGGLDYDEFAALARAVGEAPPTDAAESAPRRGRERETFRDSPPRS